MDLLNISFAILIIKIMIGAVPLVGGITYFCIDEDAKREFRNSVCNSMFGVPHAVPFMKFNRFMTVLSLLGIVFGLLVLWLLVILPMI